jgi:predicted ribosomally synthesized peptide with nif11-like leader
MDGTGRGLTLGPTPDGKEEVMSQAAASAFLDRVESDDKFMHDLESVKEDPNAVYEKVTAAGFDATPEEIRAQFLDRYGAELTPEQLDQIAAGMDGLDYFGAAVGGMIGVGLAAAICAAS